MKKNGLIVAVALVAILVLVAVVAADVQDDDKDAYAGWARLELRQNQNGAEPGKACTVDTDQHACDVTTLMQSGGMTSKFLKGGGVWFDAEFMGENHNPGGCVVLASPGAYFGANHGPAYAAYSAVTWGTTKSQAKIYTFDKDGNVVVPLYLDVQWYCANLNQSPDCTAAYGSPTTLWPPNYEFVGAEVMGVTDPDGDPVSITIDTICQDEPLEATGDGAFMPDGQVVDGKARVRAERAGSGNGRFYHIGFTANDGKGGTCSGTVQVSVPTSQGEQGAAVDDGPLYNSMP
jgi:hypothetical protein